MIDRRQRPSFIEERRMEAQGYRFIAGIDEAGRGSLAGPVVAAAVILPADMNAARLREVMDSKQLRPAMREFLFPRIHDIAISVGVGVIGHDTVDSLGIVAATRLAMKNAVGELSHAPEMLLIDYVHLPDVVIPQKGIIHGDCLSYSIACASIIAKVTRDRLMVEYDSVYPGYGLARHKGYGTEQHVACLHQLGPCSIHRRSFQPIRGMVMV